MDHYCELCKAWGHEFNHETCKYVKKFKCMCGCERKFNMVELKNLGLNSRTKIKCKRPLLECRECEKTSMMLFSIYQGGKYLKSLCPKCLIKIYETYKELRDVEGKMMSECQIKINNALKIKEFYNNKHNSKYRINDIQYLIKADVIKKEDLSEEYQNSIEDITNYNENKRILHGSHYIGTEANKKLILYKSSYNIYKNIIYCGIVLLRHNIPKGIRHKIIMGILSIYISEMNDIKVSEYYKNKY